LNDDARCGPRSVYRTGGPACRTGYLRVLDRSWLVKEHGNEVEHDRRERKGRAGYEKRVCPSGSARIEHVTLNAGAGRLGVYLRGTRTLGKTFSGLACNF
jgi:hypothetical protein